MIFSLLRPRAVAGRSFRIRALVVVGIIATTVATHAESRYWRTNAGGTFGSTTNWSATETGATGASPPAAGDTAIFNLTPTYTVGFGGNVVNTSLLIANGTVTFDLNANEYKVTSPQGIVIGSTATQTGRLTIKDGTLGADSGDDLVSVGAAFASGALTITTGGRLGNGVVRPDLMIGNAGSGTLTIEDNGRADVGYFVVGQGENSTGTATISGPNVIVTTESVVDVGAFGAGSLTIQNSATMTTGLAVTFGAALGASGNVTITGTNSTWSQANAMTIGAAGDGGLTIQSSGSMNTAGAVTIGQFATGIGAAVVTGADSLWNMSSGLAIGSSGFGNLAATSGGRIVTAGGMAVAQNAGSEGNAVVTGAGSRWDTNTLTLGVGGTGKLTINAGGVMNTTGNVSFATLAAGVGTAKLTGTGSKWNITGSVNVAEAGTGNLTVESGAILAVTENLTIGDPAGPAFGTLDFNGGTITAGGFTRTGSSVFNWTDGTLLITHGSMNNGGANLTINGADLDDVPALRLSAGATSLATGIPHVTVGSSRQGALIVSGGSAFQATTAAFGSMDGGSGVLVVEGTNSLFSTSGDLGLGGTTTSAGGLGTVTLGTGGTVNASGTLRLWSGATINLNGGTLSFNSLAASGGRVTFNSGVVRATSTLNANADVLDALVGVSRVLGVGRRIETPNGPLNLQSDFTVSGGELEGNSLSVAANVIARVGAGASAIFTNGITNPVGARFFVTESQVSAGTTFNNGGELQLAGGTATVNATTLANTGLVNGSGRINGLLTNSTAATVRVSAGERLEILGTTGSHTNNGLIDVDGGSIEFGRSVTNSSASPSTGLIAARNASLRFQSGLINNGSLTFTSGISDVFGDITNQSLTTSGRIIVTGGSQANFFDDITNNSTIQVSAAGGLQSTAVFLGSLSGAGAAGGGHVFLEGDTRPGFSPGTMSFGGDVSFGPFANLEIELAGTTPGTQYDRVAVTKSATIDGTLKVTLLDGFKPVIGNSFQIFTAAGGVTGTFADDVLPALAGGASWSVGYASQAITLSVGGVLGDFNLDGIVNAGDYTVWRNLLGSNSLVADASGNGVVDQADYNIWKSNFGDIASAGGGSLQSTAVPEPATIVSFLLLAVILPFVFPGLSRRR